jgi:enoyl-CoA hydratase/carnithine racemase
VPDPSPTFVRVDHDGPVAILTLDRPDRLNAMGDTMDGQFWDALEAIYANPDTRCILWRGEGRSFSSGRDVNDLGNRPPGMTDYQYIAGGHARTHTLLVPPKIPIVCAIQGWCIGGSFERTLLCDMRIAAEDAKFRLPELVHGLIPDSGGSARLFQMCGHGVVTDLVLTARVMAAEEALRHGIVSRVVPAAELDAVALEAARTIAAMPPLAVRAWRQALSDLATPPVTKSLHDELLGQLLVYSSQDFAEFRAARSEGRTPLYRTT